MKHLYKIVFIIITIVVIIFLSTLDIYAYGDHKSLVTGSFAILADEKVSKCIEKGTIKFRSFFDMKKGQNMLKYI